MNEHVDLSVAKCATDTDASVAEGSRKRPLIGPFTEDDVNKRSFYALTRKRFFGCNSAINAKGRSRVLKATEKCRWYDNRAELLAMCGADDV